MSEDEEGDGVIQSQRSGETTAFYDPRALQRLREIDPSGVFLRRWVGIFLTEAPERLAAMERAMAAGIPEPIGRIAHSLKSYAGWLGSQQLWSLCDQVEQAAADGAVEECRLLLPTLRQQLRLFQDWLARFAETDG